MVSVPSFGDSFFIRKEGNFMLPKFKLFPSPHSEILFLFIVSSHSRVFCRNGFRPLIRGFFFYILELVPYAENSKAVSVPSFGEFFFFSTSMELTRVLYRHVSVPSFGDSFFMDHNTKLNLEESAGFRPLIRGFFFYAGCCLRRIKKKLHVSVPSFGDSFFMSVSA